MSEGCNKTCMFSALGWRDYSVLLEWLFCITLSAHHLLLCDEQHHLLLFGAVWRTPPSANIWCCVKNTTICYHLVLREEQRHLLSFGAVWRTTPSAIISCCVKMEKEHPNVSALVRDGGDRSEGQKPSRLLTSGYSEQNFTTIYIYIYAFFFMYGTSFLLLYISVSLSLYIYMCVCVCVCVCVGGGCSMYGNANWCQCDPCMQEKKCSTQLNSSLQNKNYRR